MYRFPLYPSKTKNDEQAALAHDFLVVLIGQYVLRVELAHGACSRQQSQALPQLAGASARRCSQGSSSSSGWLVVLAFKLPCLDELPGPSPVRLRLDGVHGAASQAGLHPLFGPACLVASNSWGKFCGKMVSKYTSPIYGKYIIYLLYIIYNLYIYIWSSFSFVTKNMTHFWTSGEPPTEIIHGVVLQHLRNGSTNPNISQCSVSSIPDFRVVFSFVFDDLNYCPWCFENSAAPPCRPKLTYSNLLSFIYFGSLGIAPCHVGLSLNLPFCSSLLSRELTYPTWRKGSSSSKVPFYGIW